MGGIKISKHHIICYGLALGFFVIWVMSIVFSRCRLDLGKQRPRQTKTTSNSKKKQEITTDIVQTLNEGDTRSFNVIKNEDY